MACLFVLFNLIVLLFCSGEFSIFNVKILIVLVFYLLNIQLEFLVSVVILRIVLTAWFMDLDIYSSLILFVEFGYIEKITREREKISWKVSLLIFFSDFDLIYSMLSSSTSNVKREFGGMIPGCPREP